VSEHLLWDSRTIRQSDNNTFQNQPGDNQFSPKFHGRSLGGLTTPWAITGRVSQLLWEIDHSPPPFPVKLITVCATGYKVWLHWEMYCRVSIPVRLVEVASHFPTRSFRDLRACMGREPTRRVCMWVLYGNHVHSREGDVCARSNASGCKVGCGSRALPACFWYVCSWTLAIGTTSLALKFRTREIISVAALLWDTGSAIFVD